MGDSLFRDLEYTLMIVYCSECQYWVRHNLPEWGQCRRNAPSPQRSIAEHFIGPYNQRAIWPFTRNTDFCGQGETGEQIEVPEVSENQEAKLDTLPKINSFDSSVQEAREKVKESSLLFQVGK